MKLSRDTRMAIFALLPMILVMSVPLLSVASTSAQPVSSKGQLINLLDAYGFIDEDDPAPLHVLTFLFGYFLGSYWHSTGMTWNQLSAVCGMICIPFFVAIYFFPAAAIPLGLTGFGWILVAN